MKARPRVGKEVADVGVGGDDQPAFMNVRDHGWRSRRRYSERASALLNSLRDSAWSSIMRVTCSSR